MDDTDRRRDGDDSDSSTAPARDPRVLVVSNDPLQTSLVAALEESGYHARLLKELDDFDADSDEWAPDVIAIDDRMPHPNARHWVQRAKQTAGAVCILLVDTYNPRTLARAIDLGAEAFLPREAPLADFIRVVAQELKTRVGLAARGPRIQIARMVGESPESNEICRKVAVTAPSNATVLITGESGTGKELVARAIHRFSPRRDQPFIAINCGAISADLIESELFGHVKGAFTGAIANRIGRFERAHGGTLFLDEIAELSPALQIKLLRVLQEKEFEPVGASATRSVDVRLVAATNVDLERDVREGRFRADLFYRLNVLRLELPPLRARRGDIRELWRHFVHRCAKDEGRTNVESDPRVDSILLRHDWPGNIRELENVARHAVAMRAGQITPGALPAYIGETAKGEADEGLDVHEELVEHPGMSLKEVERGAILRTVEATESIKEAAEILEISERKLYYRLKQYRQDGLSSSHAEE